MKKFLLVYGRKINNKLIKENQLIVNEESPKHVIEWLKNNTEGSYEAIEIIEIE